MVWNIKERILAHLNEHLSEKRRDHVFRVAGLSRQLAERHGGDADKAELAALFHDSMREAEREVLDRMMIQSGMPDYYLGNRNLSHGKAAAVMMERDYDITDPDLLDPVAYHTTGRPGMSLAEKILYVADAAEPGRDYPGVSQLRRLSYEDLDEACLYSMDRTIRYVKERGGFLDPLTLWARKYLKEQSIPAKGGKKAR